MFPIELYIIEAGPFLECFGPGDMRRKEKNYILLFFWEFLMRKAGGEDKSLYQDGGPPFLDLRIIYSSENICCK